MPTTTTRMKGGYTNMLVRILVSMGLALATSFTLFRYIPDTRRHGFLIGYCTYMVYYVLCSLIADAREEE